MYNNEFLLIFDNSTPQFNKVINIFHYIYKINKKVLFVKKILFIEYKPIEQF